MYFMASWAKKELAKLKIHTISRFLLPPVNQASVSSSPLPLVQEVVLAADLRCPGCLQRVSDAISSIDDMESMVVHVAEKKVSLVRKSVAKGGPVEVALSTT